MLQALLHHLNVRFATQAQPIYVDVETLSLLVSR